MRLCSHNQRNHLRSTWCMIVIWQLIRDTQNLQTLQPPLWSVRSMKFGIGIVLTWWSINWLPISFSKKRWCCLRHVASVISQPTTWLDEPMMHECYRSTHLSWKSLSNQSKTTECYHSRSLRRQTKNCSTSMTSHKFKKKTIICKQKTNFAIAPRAELG